MSRNHIKFLIVLVFGFLTACQSAKYIEYPSANYNTRARMIIIHHTTIDFQESLEVLTQPSANPVSAHYLIPAPDDPTYPHRSLKAYALVPESKRAWHAGQSDWQGKAGLNDQSIGIELVYVPTCTENTSPEFSAIEINLNDICSFYSYPNQQISLLIDLLSDIQKRHPDISPTNIVGHSDIAPDRKVDPGPLFPWKQLYEQGFGAWYDEEAFNRYRDTHIKAPRSIHTVQKALSSYGYKIEETGSFDKQTRKVVRAFQLHFQPEDISGIPTPTTSAILFALLEKYHPDKLLKLIMLDR
ncbi:N-acetylmuramoyl-L-alanine amidase [Kordiimonas sp. SCSIO 12610]|uniref:N-acetylmuramoyl-L-alanine amidase n=1 Tax=Kordiimonas sp. SCSIO 12610 TaxID=2829597 RepID=UPI00210F0916|nr:N-acetylmuramoyl-L-alanine amidase [Kordiimonas sp. SCSIO 12610]UTW55030.1 N-acetylmuramoyl-L-alanine amidase [Kordiimonas sp. SCSIO 12610]